MRLRARPATYPLDNWWDSVLESMFASGMETKYIDKFVTDFNAKIQAAFGGIKPPDIELPKIKPPNSTADDITQAFQAISGGFQRSGFDKTIQDVLNNGFVEFSKAPSADAFRKMFDNWNEEFVNGKYRFTPLG